MKTQNIIPGPELKFDDVQYGPGYKLKSKVVTPRVFTETGELQIPNVLKDDHELNLILGDTDWSEILQGLPGVTIGRAPEEHTAQVTHFYGDGGRSDFEELVEGAVPIALIILAGWVGFQFLKALTQGVRAVFQFAWSLVTLPFRAVWFVLRFVFSLPRRLFGLPKKAAEVGRAGVVGAGRVVGGTYTAFAQGFNDEEGRRLTRERATRTINTVRKRSTAAFSSVACSGALTRAKARVEHARKRLQQQLDRDAPRHAIERAKKRLAAAKLQMEAVGRRVGQRLSHLGVDSAPAPAQGPWVDPSAGESNHAFATYPGDTRTPQFPGYKIQSELPRGGSGARLFLAKPRREHAARLAERGTELPAQVVIKSFSLQGGAHMSGILREGRALDAAKRLGQVFEHVSGDDGLFYVMPYVPGLTLDDYIAKLHGYDKDRGLMHVGDAEALTPAQLEEVLALQLDLMTELERFHNHGLWHKDIKPGNLIVDKGRMRVVDLGLLTPLASALTLTTHGTEYYRDPEMVRLAMRGAQVRDTEAAKFDLYSAGAVLFSMLEGTFPAHGNLSRLQRPCPTALGWVVRRAMSEHDSRYASASAMRADVEFLLSQKDLNKVKPKDLPSWGGASTAPQDSGSVPASMDELESNWARREDVAPSEFVEPPSGLSEEGLEVAVNLKSSKGAKGQTGSKKGNGKKERVRFSSFFKVVAGLVLLAGLLATLADERGAHARPSDRAVEAVQSTVLAPRQLPASWGRDTVVDLLSQVQPNTVRSVHIHGVPVNQHSWQIHEQLDRSLQQFGLKRTTWKANEESKDLDMAVATARLLDGIPLQGSPSEKELLKFFMEHRNVQAVYDYRQQRWWPSPLVRQWQ